MPTPAPSLAAPQALTDLSGTVLASSYRLGRVLGAGGMGAVFEATQLSLGRKVAIKVLRPVFVGHEEFTRRFVREAKAAASIEHPNVVEIIDVNEAAGGLVFTVMKLLDGQDLEAYLRAQPEQRLPWAKACGLLAQVAAGLKAAHERGVIHRDIKPANCFLTTGPDGMPLVKVVDFGIAKLDDADQTQQLTGTAEVLGTPAYIAPELVRTKSPASPRSDVYSLGVLAYRMLAGRVPFTGETHFEVLHHSCFDPIPPLGDRVPDLPLAVERLVLQMLAKEPDLRPQSMQAVRDALLSLGRDTLGPTAVEISGSAAIAITAPLSNDTPEANKTTPLPISANVLGASSTSAALESTEMGALVQEMPAKAPEKRPANTNKGEVRQRLAATGRETGGVLEALGSGSLWTDVGDPGASGSGEGTRTEVLDSGPTTPVPRAVPGPGPAPMVAGTTERTEVMVSAGFREPTGRPLPDAVVAGVEERTEVLDSGKVERPPRRPAGWLVGGGVAVAVVSGVVAWVMMQGGKQASPREAGEGEVAVAVGEQPSSMAVAVTPEVSATKAVTPVPVDDAKPVEPVEVALVEVAPVVETEPESPKPRVKPPKTSAGPPTDAALKKKLERKIKTKCATELAGKSVMVVFDVTTAGGVKRLTAMPKGAAGECAKRQLDGVAFRSRDRETNIEIEVK